MLPLDTGGKLRTWHLMRQLAAHHEITYLGFETPDQRREHIVSQEFDHDETAIRSCNRELAERAVSTAMADCIGQFCSPGFPIGQAKT